MLKNKKFARYTIFFMIIGFLYFFFYSGLQTDHMNILTPYLTSAYGWSDLKITNPLTFASIAAIVFYFVCGIGIDKIGVRKILGPCLVLVGVSMFGIAVSGENYGLYATSLFVNRLFIVPIHLGAMMLASNWYIRFRGRVLGVITAGGCFFSCVGIQILTRMANTSGVRVSYTILGFVLIVMAVLTLFVLRDKPEELGMYPDGADRAPVSEVDDSESMTLKEVLGHKEAWQLIVTFGVMQFVICAIMPYNAVRYIALSEPGTNLFQDKAMLFLSVGAACGLPMSYIIGWIDDKLGSIKASVILNLTMFLAAVPMAIMPVGGNSVLMFLWAFGIACMTGGVATMHPCVTAYVFGRKKYMAANKYIITIQAIPNAFAVMFMAAFNTIGHLEMAYYILTILLIISLVVLFFMRKIPDANEADRDYGKKQLD